MGGCPVAAARMAQDASPGRHVEDADFWDEIRQRARGRDGRIDSADLQPPITSRSPPRPEDGSA